MFVIPVFENMFASVGLALPLPTRDRHRAVELPATATGGRSIGGDRRRRRSCIKKLLRDVRAASCVIDQLLLQGAGARRRAAQVGGVALHAHARHADLAPASASSTASRSRRKTAGNRVIQDAIMAVARQSIAGGDTIAAPLQKSAVFPPMVISMIAVGEQTGGLDEMLSKIADFYDDEVDAAVSGAAVAARADHDRVPRRRRRRHGRRDVPADLRHDQRGAVGRAYLRPPRHLIVIPRDT